LSKDALLAQTFVQLADSLTADFDVVDLLTLLVDRANELLGARSGGIVLGEGAERLTVVAASTEEARLLEVFQIQGEGPCVDCVRSGQAVDSADLGTDERWPNFTRLAEGVGYRAVASFPLRLRSIVLGALNVFFTEPGAIGEIDAVIAQAMADVATIAVLQHRAKREAAEVVTQLQSALNSRIVIEQAKGVLAERAGITTNEAFSRLREYARSHNLRLTDLAADIVNRTLDAAVEAGLTALGDVSRRPKGH